MSEVMLVERLKSLSAEFCGPVREALLDAAMALTEADALVARLAEADEKLWRIRRTSEVTAQIMRNPERTGGWSGAERVARQFDRIAKLAATADSGLGVKP